VVGATGGSGTRVVARILREAGLYTGDDLNESDDALRFGGYSDRWINEYVAHPGGIPENLEREMLDDLDRVLADHCRPIAADPGRWGWKEPRSIYLLRFYAAHLPSLRFVHVVRDGRDMALSTNQNQLRKHGDAAGVDTRLPDPVRSIRLWSWINRQAAELGARELFGRYLRLRFEDLCADPTGTARTLLGFVELDASPERAHGLVTAPPTLGRWKGAEPQLRAELEHEAGDALRDLGYEVLGDAR
jgi:hypothetical protein